MKGGLPVKKRNIILPALFFLLVLLLVVNFDSFNYLINSAGIKPITIKNTVSYTSEDFGIAVVKSDIDFNNNGIDDYTDILNGAKAEAQSKPKYKSAYYEGGYPPDDEGVCTDTLWRALRNAGYSLRDLVDTDIESNPGLYTDITIADSNIDFRRVKNLMVFFDKNYLKLTDDPHRIEEWMPGDIVIFGTSHIAIVSDKRNEEGIPYIIHNAGQYNREEDALLRWCKSKGVTGHYRFVMI
jgi:uncharacterized protein YijF (DUF1287 family)